MDLGHGFLPRIDSRNYKAVERCLPRNGPGLFHEGLDLPWAILEGPWALESGDTTIELCRDRHVSFLVDTQAWRYRDARTFLVPKFAQTKYAPSIPLADCDATARGSFVRACFEAQASLGASAYLLPGLVPKGRDDDIRGESLALLDAAEKVVPGNPRPCFAFIGAHTGSMEAAYKLVDDLPHWLEGVYLQVTPLSPMSDSPSKIIDILLFMRYAAQKGFTVIGGRLGGLGSLARALDIPGADAGLGEGESFDYGPKVAGCIPRSSDAKPPRPVTGRLYVPQLGRSVSSAEWGRLMQIPALCGQLLCKLPCCAFGRTIETTPGRGREHSLHCRVAEARTPIATTSGARLENVLSLLEQRQSFARMVGEALSAAGLEPIATGFVDNHVAAASYFRRSFWDVA